MLTVYTYLERCPSEAVDLSAIPLDELAAAVLDVCQHQTSARIWLGYLEGWMLTPQEEVLLRQAVRKFDCGLVTHFPLSLSHAWQNEIRTIYTADPNGAPNANDNGGALQHGSPAGHGQSRSQSAPDQGNHKGRKAGRPPKGRVQTRQDSAPKDNSSAAKDNGVRS